MIEKSQNQNCLAGKCVILGISGSIAAYKSADLAGELRKAGAEVFVVMTDSAKRFITPLTLATISRNPVSSSLWEEANGWLPEHIDLADRADLLLVAPATANQLANFASGTCSDLLSSVYLATNAPTLMAPAMNGKMFEHKATTRNLEILEARGVSIIPPETGELACGYLGSGKMASIDEIINKTFSILS